MTQAKQQGKEGLGAVMQAMSDEKQSDKGPPEVAVVHAEGLILVGMPSKLCFRYQNDMGARALRSLSTGRALPTCHSAVIPVDNCKPDSTLPDMRHGLLQTSSTLAAGNPNSQLQNRPIIDSIKLCKLLRDLRENTAVKAVVVRVNSPGMRQPP